MYEQRIISRFPFSHYVPVEKLVLGGSKRAAKKWDQEWDSCVLPLVEDDMPSYLLYRLDTTNNQGYEWVFLAWSPDHSPVSLFACCRLLSAGARQKEIMRWHRSVHFNPSTPYIVSLV